MTSKRHRYIYGPVPSRRLGRSLGVDLVPFKTCSFDCVYCQLGKTTIKTVERKVYAPTEEVLAELSDKLTSGLECDYITLSGSGEPTLHSELGKIVTSIKQMTDIPLALLTNGSLLSHKDARSEIMTVDLLVPSLDAGDEQTFQQINRPCPEITFQSIIDGLRAVRREFPGQIRLEVFLIAGINDSDGQVRKIKAIIDEIGFEHVDLNTATRPPSERWVQPVGPERLEQIAKIIGPNTEIVAATTITAERAGSISRDDILEMLRRRPCTIDDVSAGLKCHRWEAAKIMGELLDEGLIIAIRRGDKDYYQTMHEQSAPRKES